MNAQVRELSSRGHVDADVPSIAINGELISRAERDRRLHRMRHSFAYRLSYSLVTGLCVIDTDRSTPGCEWLDTTQLLEDEGSLVGEALTYLELARLLHRHPIYPHLVRVREFP